MNACAPHTVERPLANAAATEQLGAWLASRFAASAPGGPPLVVTLSGELGTGKSTLARALLRHLGVTGPIRSPTYTLAEPYTLAGGASACHLDLYRLGDPEEAEFIGIRDILRDCRLVLVEWPERFPALLERADLVIRLAYARDGGPGRSVRIRARRRPWDEWLRALSGTPAP